MVRILLQGKPYEPDPLDDLWLVLTASDSFNTASYLAQGYDTLDAYIVGAGGAGAPGGNPSSPDAYTFYGGGGGGGGGGGQLVTLSAIDLFALPDVIPYVVGKGVAFGQAGGSLIAGRGFASVFNGCIAYGGNTGGSGSNAPANRNGGGGSGGVGGPGNADQTYWNAANPDVPEKGPTGLAGSGAGDGGWGGTTNNAPTKGKDGSLVVVSANVKNFGGGGGGGGGFCRSNAPGDPSSEPQARGGAGGKGYLSTSAPTGFNKVPGEPDAITGGQGFYNLRPYYFGQGGAGGSGHNLGKISRIAGMGGVPDLISPDNGVPGAGGMGGYGGIGTVQPHDGSIGSDGRILLHIYRR